MRISSSDGFIRTAKVVLALTAFFSLSAFRHTDIEGYTDPNYTGYQFQTVVVQFSNTSLKFKKVAIKQLQKHFKKYNVRMYQHDQLFAPTREWTEEASRAVYEQYGIDAGLVITLGSSGADSTAGGVLYNTSTVAGTTTGYATQVTIHRDNASFEISLVDIDTIETVWVGQLDTRGAGLLFTGAKSTAKGLVKGLVKEWKKVGHLSK